MSLVAKGRALVAWVLGVVLVLGLLLATSLLVLKTDWARAEVARRASAFVSDQIRGRIEIGALDRVSLSSITARNVKVVDPQGHTAIEAEHVVVQPDLSSLARGRVVFQGEVRDGTVRLRTAQNGNINLTEAFSMQPTPTDESQSSRGTASDEGPRPIDVRITTSDMALVLAGESLPSLRFEDVHGIMRVHNADERGLWLQFDTYRGAITRGLPTGTLQFEDVSGHVQTYGKRLLRFRGEGDFSGNELQFELDMMDEPKRHVEVHANFPEPSAAAFASRAVEAYSALSDDFEVHVSHGR